MKRHQEWASGRRGEREILSIAPSPTHPLSPSARRPSTGSLLLRLSLLLALFAPAGCGYIVGSPYGPEVRSVYVPTFTSVTFRRGVEYQLTEAVQKQIQMRTPYRLVSEENADTRLTGKIISADKTLLGETGFDDARELQVSLIVEVTWEDLRTGEILRQQKVPLSPDVIRMTSQSEFAPEVGQSLATADRTAVDRLARNIVDMMETPW